LRDLKNHGFCILEKDLVLEDETIWGGYSHDLFNEKVVEYFDGQPFLMIDQPNGDLLIKKPETPLEMAKAIAEAKNAMNEQIDRQEFGSAGLLIN
jgi:hypothetical protein